MPPDLCQHFKYVSIHIKVGRVCGFARLPLFCCDVLELRLVVLGELLPPWNWHWHFLSPNVTKSEVFFLWLHTLNPDIHIMEIRDKYMDNCTPSIDYMKLTVSKWEPVQWYYARLHNGLIFLWGRSAANDIQDPSPNAIPSDAAYLGNSLNKSAGAILQMKYASLTLIKSVSDKTLI